MTRIATLFAAAAAFAVTLPIAANADSYINSQQYTGSHSASASGKATVKHQRAKKRVHVRPASTRSGVRYNFGTFVRDTSREGYGPNGGR